MSSLLHHAIIDSATREPDREAFRHGNESLTYAQLVERTSRVAGLLRSLDVTRGDRVGLYLHKSIDLAPAVYGTLAAGAAYVPIDPAAPPERVRFIVEDCGIRHLITGRSRARRARATAEAVPDLGYVLGADAPDDTNGTTTYVPWSAVDAMSADAPDDALGAEGPRVRHVYVWLDRRAPGADPHARQRTGLCDDLGQGLRPPAGRSARQPLAAALRHVHLRDVQRPTAECDDGARAGGDHAVPDGPRRH